MNRVIDVIASGRSFLITAHVRLDGDAVGSELALYHLLRTLGKEAVVYNQDPTPKAYQFLPGSNAIIHTLDAVDYYDAVFLLDCSEIDRVGDAAALIASAKQLVCIDHHISNKGEIPISIVDPSASSVGEILYRLIDGMGVTVTQEMAVNLYTAILTDTGSFRYSNTGKETFRIAGQLVGKGADPYGIAERIYESQPKEKIRLLAEVLRTLEFAWDGRISMLFLSRQVLRSVGTLAEYTENLVDVARGIDGVEVAAFFMEMAENHYKVSLRSKGRISVERVAARFGGGGHFAASSCQLKGDLTEVRERILQAVMTG